MAQAKVQFAQAKFEVAQAKFKVAEAEYKTAEEAYNAAEATYQKSPTKNNEKKLAQAELKMAEVAQANYNFHNSPSNMKAWIAATKRLQQSQSTGNNEAERFDQELFTAHTKQSGTPLTVHQALVLKNLDDRRAAVKALKDFEKIKESSPEHRSYRGGAASQALPPKRSPSPTPRIGSMPSEP